MTIYDMNSYRHSRQPCEGTICDHMWPYRRRCDPTDRGRNHMRPYVTLQVGRGGTGEGPYATLHAAATQVKPPYATICDLTGRSHATACFLRHNRTISAHVCRISNAQRKKFEVVCRGKDERQGSFYLIWAPMYAA